MRPVSWRNSPSFVLLLLFIAVFISLRFASKEPHFLASVRRFTSGMDVTCATKLSRPASPAVPGGGHLKDADSFWGTQLKWPSVTAIATWLIAATWSQRARRGAINRIRGKRIFHGRKIRSNVLMISDSIQRRFRTSSDRTGFLTDPEQVRLKQKAPKHLSSDPRKSTDATLRHYLCRSIYLTLFQRAWEVQNPSRRCVLFSFLFFFFAASE